MCVISRYNSEVIVTPDILYLFWFSGFCGMFLVTVVEKFERVKDW